MSDDASEFDPIGAGETFDIPARTLRAGPPSVPQARARLGAVLTAISGVSETRHEIHVAMGTAEAQVSVLIELRNTSRHAAEVLYRLPVPPRANLDAFGLCTALAPSECDGRPEGLKPGRAADFHWATARHASHAETEYAELVADTRLAEPAQDPLATPERFTHGWARHDRASVRRGRFASTVHSPADHITIRAAAVPPSGRLRMLLRYRVATPMLSGETLLVLPARPEDPRVAKAAVSGEAGITLLGQPIETPVEMEPFLPLELAFRHTARYRPVGTLRFARCAGRDTYCGTLELSAAPEGRSPTPRRGGARRYAIAVDTSPSMRGPAQGRLRETLHALSATLVGHGDESMTWFTFGPTTRRLTDVPSVTAAIQQALNSVEQGERALTSLAGLLQELKVGTKPTDLVLVGDGGYGAHGEDFAALADLSSQSIRLHYVQLRRRPIAAALADAVRRTGGQLLNVADLVDDARRMRRSEPLTAALGDFVRADPKAQATLLIQSRSGTVHETVSMPAPGASTEIPLHFTGPPPTKATLRYRGQRVAVTLDADAPRPGTAMANKDAVAWLVGPHAQDSLSREEDGDPSPRGGDASAASANDARVLFAGTCEIDGLASRMARNRTSGGAPTANSSRHGRRRDAGSSAHETLPIALATRACEVEALTADAGESGRGVPAETVQQSLRSQVIPKARLCLRADRRGRPNYQVRVAFDFALEDQEVRHSAVEGIITPALRSCLEDALLALEVPYFEGTVRVHYPIYTLRALEAPVIQMSVESAEAVDALLAE